MNVMMTGRRRCALALLLAALVLSGCGKKDAPDAPEQTAQTAAYSNLRDEASKELLSELFADAGIAAERADKFFACFRYQQLQRIGKLLGLRKLCLCEWKSWT